MNGDRWSSRLAWGGLLAGTAFTLALVCFPLLAGRAAPRWDAEAQFAPYFTLVGDFGRAGRLLAWNPWSNAGAPDGADPQWGAASPVTVLLATLLPPGLQGFVVYWLLLWWLGGVGLALFARHLGAPWWGAWIATLGYLLSGFYVGQAEHTSHVYAMAFLPWLLWRLDIALLEDRARPAVEAGALLGTSLLGGYPGLTLLHACFAGLWAMGRLLPSAGGEGRRARWAGVAVSLGVMAGVAAVTASPVLAGFRAATPGYSGRSEALPRQVAVLDNALSPGSLTTLAEPYLLDLKLWFPEQLWPATDPSMCSLYVGAASFLLALLALSSRPRDPWRWWLIGLAVLAVACALGRTLPLRGWLYDLLPPFRYFRHPAVFRVYAMLAVIVLGALGSRDLGRATPGELRRRLRRLGTIAVVTALAAVAAVGTVLVGLGERPDSLRYGLLHLALVWVAPALALTVLGRLRRPQAWLLPALLVVLAWGDAVTTGLIGGPFLHDDGAELSRWRGLERDHVAALDLTPHGLFRAAWPSPGGPRSNDNLLTKQPVFASYSPLANRFHRAMVEVPELLSMAVGEQRLWFADQVAVLPPSPQLFAALVARARSLGRAPLAVHPRRLMFRPPLQSRDADPLDRVATLPAAEPLAATVLAYTPDRLTLRVEAPRRGWILVTDRWAPGWRATVDGRPAPVQGGNLVFRAVEVAAGPHRLRFVYSLPGRSGLLAASWGSLLVIALLPAAAAWRRRSTTTGPAVE